jgi:hypothetical protein
MLAHQPACDLIAEIRGAGSTACVHFGTWHPEKAREAFEAVDLVASLAELDPVRAVAARLGTRTRGQRARRRWVQRRWRVSTCKAGGRT